MGRQGERKEKETGREGRGRREREERGEGERGDRKEDERGENRCCFFVAQIAPPPCPPHPHPQWRLAATFAVADSPLRLQHAAAGM